MYKIYGVEMMYKNICKLFICLCVLTTSLSAAFYDRDACISHKTTIWMDRDGVIRIKLYGCDYIVDDLKHDPECSCNQCGM